MAFLSPPFWFSSISSKTSSPAQWIVSNSEHILVTLGSFHTVLVIPSYLQHWYMLLLPKPCKSAKYHLSQTLIFRIWEEKCNFVFLTFCFVFFFLKKHRGKVFAARKMYSGLGRVGNPFDSALQQPENFKEQWSGFNNHPGSVYF